MPTHVRQKSDDFYVLTLSPWAQIKGFCATAFGGSIAALPVKILALAPAAEFIAIGVAFTAAAIPIYNAMERRAIKNGNVQIKQMKKPKIEV